MPNPTGNKEPKKDKCPICEKQVGKGPSWTYYSLVFHYGCVTGLWEKSKVDRMKTTIKKLNGPIEKLLKQKKISPSKGYYAQ